MRFVPIKNVEQQSVLSMHRVREGFVKARRRRPTRFVACSASYGRVVPQGIAYISDGRQCKIKPHPICASR